jgi:hypothetical protein
LPEIEELQRQMAATTEELSDCKYQWEQDKAEAASVQRSLQQDREQLEQTVRELTDAKAKAGGEVSDAAALRLPLPCCCPVTLWVTQQVLLCS